MWVNSWLDVKSTIIDVIQGHLENKILKLFCKYYWNLNYRTSVKQFFNKLKKLLSLIQSVWGSLF